MKPKNVRKLLMREIEKVSGSVEEFCLNPGRDFTRNRKIPVDKLMLSIIGMESGNLTNELLDCYDVSPDTPTASAFVQQRLKLKPEAFESVFHGFSRKINKTNPYETPIFAVDGSDIPISADPKDDASFFPGTNVQKPYGLLHMNALYDLNHRTYVDAILQKRRDFDEHAALVSMVDRSPVEKAIVTNLNRNEFPPSELKKMYSYRWGIETSFRDLKYTVGLLDFHSKKVACIQQEIYARLIMYYFAEMITSQVSIRKKQRKHVYKANFSVAVHMCRLYYRGKVTLPVLETIIAKNLVPIRPNRHRERNLSSSGFHSFLYRVA